ncbi:MAG: DoxX family membrane protein [Chloroflexota bacterium]
MNPAKETQQVRQIVALLRITLGVILLVTWYDNLIKGLYTADGLTGFFNWLFSPDGNNSSLLWFRDLLNARVLANPGLFATFQMVFELLLALALIFGVFTPIAGLGSAVFFFSLFLSYFGGHEWIWTYVLLTMSAVVVGLTRSGRAFGLDQMLAQRFNNAFYV